MKKILTLGISMSLLIFLSSFMVVNVNTDKIHAKTIKKSVLKHKKAFDEINIGYFTDSSGTVFHAFASTDLGIYDLKRLDFDNWVEVPFGGAYFEPNGDTYYIDSIWYISGAGSYTGVTRTYP